LTLAAAGAHWASGTGEGPGSGHGSSGRNSGIGVCGWRGRPALPRSARPVLSGPGGMMIDGVVPLLCGRAGLPGPSSRALHGVAAGHLQGAGHGGWPRCIGCVRAAASIRMRSSPARQRGVGLVAEAAQDVMGAAGELAGDRQRGPVSVDPRRDVSVVEMAGGRAAGTVMAGLEQTALFNPVRHLACLSVIVRQRTAPTVRRGGRRKERSRPPAARPASRKRVQLERAGRTFVRARARSPSACSNAGSMASRSCCVSPWDLATVRHRVTARVTSARTSSASLASRRK
jgi:hypothetical protein